MKYKKKILYLITQSELGGAGCYVLDLIKELKTEFDVEVGFGEQGGLGEIAEKLKELNIRTHILTHLKREVLPFNDFFVLFELISLIRKVKPDIIHLNSSKISILGSIATKICSILFFPSYVIYTVHGWVFNEPLKKWKKSFYFYAEKITSRFKDRLICVSEFDRKIAIEKKIAPAEKLTVIHNGIEPINFLPGEQAKKKLCFQVPPLLDKERGTEGEVIIGSIGNLYKTKGFEYLIEAVSILIKDYKLPITAVVIGGGNERKNLESLVKKSELEKNFFLVGRIDNAAQLLTAFDIYVCSSVKEGLSYTIIEAMMAGLPIIATNVGGNPELIKDNKTGLLVKSKNSKQLANKIKQFINNPELRRILSSQAKINARKNFGLDKMIKKTKKIYLTK